MTEMNIKKAGKVIILAGCLAGTVLLQSLPVMAAEMEETRQENFSPETEEPAEVEEQEMLQEAETVETGEAEAVQGEKEESREAEETVSDDIYIDAAATMPDERRSCQINMTALLPDELRIDLYADVRNVSAHTVYRLPLYFDNGYMQRCFVEPGEYTVTNIGVYDDSTGKYAFVFPEDFVLSDNEAVDLFTMLADEEAVQEEIDERLRNNSSVEESEESNPWEGLAEDKELTVPSDYEVTHTGTGGGKVGIQGEAVREHEIVIRIEKGGIPGIMTVKYSMDGEDGPWSEETAVPLSGSIALFEDVGNKAKESGMTAYFSADPRDPESLFADGDQYSAYIPDPSTELVIRHKGDGAAALVVRELVKGTHAFYLLYESGCAIRVEVLKGGTFGDAVVYVSMDGGKSFMEQMILPVDGVIGLPEIGVELVFTGSDNDSLMTAGDTYSVDAVKEDYRPLIIGVTAFLMIVGCILYGMFRHYMLQQLPSASDYRIEPYIPFAQRERQEL
ncbi:MAG: hypothetical protein IJT16_13485 [Lachnospiraceae bacterium]|nr:hypothetical protein [Lachnospiraceae bacterium]